MSLPVAITFASPIALLGLALIPLAMLLQRMFRRRAQKYAVRYTGVATLREVLGTTPLWRRHLPAALALLAMACLVLALAKPNRTVAVPAEQASVVLVTDHSRSMMATDVVQAPTTRRDDVRRIINGLVADGSTATGDALAAALEGISRDRKNGRRPPAAIVLLSDGKTTTGRDPLQVARQAGRAKVPIFTVALGTPGATIPNPYPYASPLPVPPDPVTLKRIAAESRGRAYTVEDAGELQSIYQRLGSSIGTRKRQQEITAVFAVGGLLLSAAAAAASMRWSGRLP